jgi:hypothetical protein
MSNPVGPGSSAPNRAPAKKVLEKAIANQRVADNVNAQLSGWWQPAMIIATNVSQTIDFSALQVGDIVVHIPVAPAITDSEFLKVTTAGTLGQAAVVGDLYMVQRQGNLDAGLFNPPGLG